MNETETIADIVREHSNQPNQRRMTMKKKLSVKDELQAWAAGIGIVGGLFAFSLILGVIFMDYDPRTMIEGLAEDLKLRFG